MGKKSARDSSSDKEQKSTLPKAKTVAVKAAEMVAPAAAKAVEAEPEAVVAPVAEPVKVVKKKKTRYVREKKEPRPEVKSTVAAPRTKTLAGKMMSKNIRTEPIEIVKPGVKGKKKN